MSLSSFWYYYNDEEEGKAVSQIRGISFNFDNQGRIVLRAVGTALPSTSTYDWTVKASGTSASYTSVGPELTLTAAQTATYRAADEIVVQATVDGKRSKPVTIIISKSVVGVAIAGIAIAA